MKEPVSKFVKVRCTNCKNEQVVFGKASSEINCLVCGKKLATAKGGKSQIDAKVLEILN